MLRFSSRSSPSSAAPLPRCCPLELFRSRQFTGANLVTLAVYAGLGGVFFFVVVNLQASLGYSALEVRRGVDAGNRSDARSSRRAWARSLQKTGPRLPMTIGPAIAAVGLALLGQIEAGDKYVTAVLPGVLLFGLGMSMTVAPLTAAVLGAAEERHLGIASATNNAVGSARGPPCVAIIPSVAGFELTGGGSSASRLPDGNVDLRCARACPDH